MSDEDAKDAALALLDRRAPGVARLDKKQREIVEAIVTGLDQGKTHDLMPSQVVLRIINRHNGGPLYDYVYLDQLCEIIKKLAM